MKGANRAKAEKKKKKAAERKIDRPIKTYSQSRTAQPPWAPKNRTVCRAVWTPQLEQDLKEMGAIAR